MYLLSRIVLPWRPWPKFVAAPIAACVVLVAIGVSSLSAAEYLHHSPRLGVTSFRSLPDAGAWTPVWTLDVRHATEAGLRLYYGPRPGRGESRVTADLQVPEAARDRAGEPALAAIDGRLSNAWSVPIVGGAPAWLTAVVRWEAEAEAPGLRWL